MRDNLELTSSIKSSEEHDILKLSNLQMINVNLLTESKKEPQMLSYRTYKVDPKIQHNLNEIGGLKESKTEHKAVPLFDRKRQLISVNEPTHELDLKSSIG